MAEPSPQLLSTPAATQEPAVTSWDVFETVIRPSTSWVPLHLDELWEYRELLAFLAWRDVKVRYKQTVLGALWAVIQPLFTMGVFTIFFGKLGGMEARLQGDTPYAVFALAALVPWGYFAHGLGTVAGSLVGSAGLLKKVYFPRLVVPLSGLLAGLVDFVIGMVLLICVMTYYGVTPSAAVLWLPAFFLLAFVTALGVGLWLSALNAQFRDVQHTLGFLTQLWMYSTPIAYPSTLLGEPWRTVYGLNPMAGVADGFRWALLGMAAPGPIVLVSAASAFAILISGAYYFRRVERTISDTV